jgi:penicillin V acylase-like amidase (Ntn superfamily)
MIPRTAFAAAALTAVTVFSLGGPVQYAEACTRIFANDKGDAMLVARSMDWATTTEPVLTAFPRGLVRDGGHAGPMTVFSDNPAHWTSQYGSVVTTIFGIGTADGVNERGLAAHMLYFPPADYGARDSAKPGVQAALWAQYALDNAATVEEALAKLETVQIVKVEIEVHGQKQTGTVHLALEDASGDSAILEYIGGKLVVHNGREFRVMTNAPEYDKQLELLSGKDFANPTMDTQVPGNVNPRDRFQRATYFLSVLTKPTSERAGVAGMFDLIRNVSIPFGAPVNGSTFDTEYRTVSNLTAKRYFFELTTAPNVIWTDLTKLNLAKGARVLTLNPNNIDLSGDVTSHFQPAKAPF